MRKLVIFVLFLIVFDSSIAHAAGQSSLSFVQNAPDDFSFDTGVLRGTLHPAGKSLGLISVIHTPSGQRMDRSNGLLSHYRVFSKGVRYGGGAWDWPSHARLLSDGAVEVLWPAAAERPFQMRAIYRWRSPNTIELETVIDPEKDLAGFESFLASYFNESFTNAAVCVSDPSAKTSMAAFVPVEKGAGEWQMFPPNSGVIPLIEDGRWAIQPNPVQWTIRAQLAYPICYRRNPATGLTALLIAPASDCFAVASPHQTEGHYSAYLSLFGRDLKAGLRSTARTRLIVGTDLAEGQMLEQYRALSE